ncbi:hypothetical protein ACF09J_26260 [Streptomyces sp. NPDC014889]|uniref:hypothetical protein n=1 Tax=Streptomyces sp. NPDC014889 TaxID=3364928 RepID=UPI0036F6293F
MGVGLVLRQVGVLQRPGAGAHQHRGVQAHRHVVQTAHPDARYRDPATGHLDGDTLPVDLAANAASLGADVIRARGLDGFREALATALAAEHTTVVHVETDPLVPVPDSDAWWDVPVAEVSALPTTTAARAAYEQHKGAQRPLLTPPPA